MYQSAERTEVSKKNRREKCVQRQGLSLGRYQTNDVFFFLQKKLTQEDNFGFKYKFFLSGTKRMFQIKLFWFEVISVRVSTTCEVDRVYSMFHFFILAKATCTKCRTFPFRFKLSLSDASFHFPIAQVKESSFNPRVALDLTLFSLSRSSSQQKDKSLQH